MLPLLFCLCSLVHGSFYVPGVSPESWKIGQDIHLNVNKITSVTTLLPYEYYYLPFCSPLTPEEEQENLGEIMSGDSIKASLYSLKMKTNVKCQVLCPPKVYKKEDSEKFVEKIQEHYFVDWVVDNLPVLYRESNDKIDGNFQRGFPLGDVDASGKYFLYNHVKIILYTHRDVEEVEERWRIVGFEVLPSSVKHQYEKDPVGGEKLNSCAEEAMSNVQFLNVDGEDTKVVFTYDVEYIDSDIPWEHRWDRIINSKTANDQIHWFSIINSLMIVLFLTGMIGMIMLRTLHRDIARYNEVQSAEEAQEESGWKLVHGDVFRQPQTSPLLFSVVVGTGVQVCCMAAATMVIALLGLLSPANRGSLLTTLLLLFVFMGSFAGYFSARTYKMFHGKDWKVSTVLTAMLYPGILFSIFFVLNLFLWAEASSQAVPFGTLFALLVLWFGISVPLVFLGSYFGFKKPAVEFPVRTNQIARQIPEQVWYLSAIARIIMGGILPFGAVFIELFFIMSALWLHQIYYVFGFLFLVLLILVATCAEVTIVMCYFQLCAEDYRWWWRSFLTSGSAALFLFAYGILYYHTKLNITAVVSTILYFGYMAMISITFFFFTGTVGYFACLWFTKKIYGSIKVD